MELLKSGKNISFCFNLLKNNVGSKFIQNQFQVGLIQSRCFAARKGYREKAKKKKVKKVVEKKPWIPQSLRVKDTSLGDTTKRMQEPLLDIPNDDVWIARRYAWRIYHFQEAIECHRETHHPTIYNVPNAPVNINIELDMRTAKPTRFVEKFKRMAILPNVFEQEGLQERSILVFCKTPEQKQEAEDAGATLVGGAEIIKEIERGKIVLPDFRFVIAHPSILPEMITIRGLLKKKFPNVRAGTLGPNIGQIVHEFKNGVEYACIKHETEADFGWIDTTIGKLNMDTLKLEENFIALIKDINCQRPKREGEFISRVRISSPPSVEKLKINLEPYLELAVTDTGESSDEDEAVSSKG